MAKTLSKTGTRWTMFIVNAIILGLVVSAFVNLKKLQEKAPVLEIDDNFKMARGVCTALVVIFSIFTGLNALAIVFKY